MLDIVSNGPHSLTDGSEAPVLVLGHSLGSQHYMWDAVVTKLKDIRVIRYDLPGHGSTPAKRREEPLTMTALLHELLETLDHLGIQYFHVAGLSLGGMVAMAAAEYSPRVLSATIMSAGPINQPSQAWWDKAALVRANGTAQLVDATLERWFTEDFRTRSGLEEVARIREIFLTCDDEGYAQCCEVLAQSDLRSDLGNIAVPVTLVSAEHDATMPWDMADQIADTLQRGQCPEVQVEHVQHLRHMLAVENPDLAAQILQARVSGC